MSWLFGIRKKRTTEMSAALKRARELAAPYKPTDVLASEHLIKARRGEVERKARRKDV